MAGLVLVDGKAETKAGTSVADDAEVTLASDPCPYVSRGGLKLESALKVFPVSVEGRVCLDMGASTGGFTDYLLQHGAAKVYAVDVGTAQLDAKLKADPRVVSKERTHARDIRPEWFSPRPTLGVIDVSFISLTKALPMVAACLTVPAEIVALIKPQFELTAKQAPKGVVQNPEYRLEAIEKVRLCLKESPSLKELGLMECPVHGPKGNVEFFIHLRSA